MAWRKSPAALAELFDRAIPADPRIARRKMFGYPAAFLNGNMLAGLHQEDFILRLPDDARAEIARDGARPFAPMPGRTMREYVALPASVIADDAAMARWLARAIDHVATLPAKAPAARAAAPKRSRRDR